MAISSIPLPQSGADAFLSGAAGTQNILSSILQGQQRNKQLDISQQGENRQQAQLPYILQKFQDAHNEAKTMLPLYAQQYKDIHGKYLSDQEQQKLYNDFIKARMQAAMHPDQGGGQPQPGAPNAGMPAPGVPSASGAPQPGQPAPQQAAPSQPEEYAGVPRDQLAQYMESNKISPENAEAIRGFLNSSGQAPGGDMAPPGMAQQPPQPQPQPQQMAPGLPQTQAPAAPTTGEKPTTPETARTNTGETILNTGDKSRYMEDAVAGLSIGNHKMPEIKTHYDQKNGVIIKTYPSGKVTVQSYAGGKTSEGANPFLQKALATQDAKLVDKLDTAVSAGYDTRSTLGELAKVTTQPAWDEMRQNPILGKHELGWYSSYGTPEQKEMVANYQTNSGQIIADMAGKFKGQFRKGEQSLLESMKPSMSDTADVARGKIKALMMMNEMMIQRNSMTSNLIRNGMTPTDAMAKADNEVKGDLLRKSIEMQVKRPEKPEENKKSDNKVSAKTIIIDSNGDEHTIDSNNLEAAKKRDPGLRVKNG